MPTLVAAPPATVGGREPIVEFLDETRSAIASGAFGSLVLSKPRLAREGPSAVRVRLIALKGAPALSFVASHATRDVTRNVGVDEGLAEIAASLGPDHGSAFAHATLHAAGSDTQLMVSRKGKATLRRHRPAPTDSAQAGHEGPAPHDRARARRLPLDLPFLHELGLIDASQRLVPAMARKWRQIDKFLEVLDHALDALSEATCGGPTVPIRVVDYGAGKGYLTFAVHEHLRRRFGVVPEVTGVELRADLVALCNGVAERAGCMGLRFVAGDLRTFAPRAVDVMIALHACDTATDHALDLGVRAGAKILVCSPCCHKELRPQLARPRLLSGLLRHGIHLGQEAEMVTDSMRALLLETCGYDAQVFEFVSLEHTSKNKMILARRRGPGGDVAERARGELADLKAFYGVREQRLESLLLGRASADADAQACQTP
ncbi:MAG TPA: SAM-dependent methyltransferase [Caldimonas sp.]|nr:SAM-dependent methyltransferase [Caldimonas sp.]